MMNAKKTALILIVSAFSIQPVFGMYHQKMGRFMTHDPLGIRPKFRNSYIIGFKQYRDGMNIYQYVNSNTFLYLDPMGEGALDWIPYCGIIPNCINAARGTGPGAQDKDYLECFDQDKDDVRAADNCQKCVDSIASKAVSEISLPTVIRAPVEAVCTTVIGGLIGNVPGLVIGAIIGGGSAVGDVTCSFKNIENTCDASSNASEKCDEKYGGDLWN